MLTEISAHFYNGRYCYLASVISGLGDGWNVSPAAAAAAAIAQIMTSTFIIDAYCMMTIMNVACTRVASQLTVPCPLAQLGKHIVRCEQFPRSVPWSDIIGTITQNCSFFDHVYFAFS